MKRQLSDSENDDVFDDDKTSPSQSCQMLTRKKRRGIIEKKRRDRINNSLSELRRLVPSAFEKQGSAKLEKAEILQLTVDHLKLLHSKGIDTFSFDPHKFAYDYHGVGFRECAAEVARYLVSVEGLDLQDPLRMRLMSHLQCFPAQTTTAKSTSSLNGQSSSWNPPSHYTAAGTSLPVSHNMQISSSSSLDAFSYDQNRFYDNTSGLSSHHSAPPTHFQPNFSSLAQPSSTSNIYANHGHSSQSQYPVHLGSSSHHGSFQPVPSLVSYPPSTSASSMQSKPYRPWGAEIAY